MTHDQADSDGSSTGTRSRSHVVWMDDEDNANTNTNTSLKRRRHGHILALLGQSFVHGPWFVESGEDRQLYPSAIHWTFAAFVAFQDLQQRRGHILPWLPAHLDKHCPKFVWTYQARDTMFNPKQAVEQLLDSLPPEEDNTTTTITPYAIIGGFIYDVASPLATVSSSLNIPLISGTAYSGPVEDADELSTRTILNVGDAQTQAGLLYLRDIGVNHVALFYFNHPCCAPHPGTWKKIQDELGMTVLPVSYDATNVRPGLQLLLDSNYRYIFCVSGVLEELLLAAYQMGLAGPNSQRVWLHAEKPELLSPQYMLPRSNDTKAIAAAFHGSAVVNVHVLPNQALDTTLSHDFFHNTQLQRDYMQAQHVETSEYLLEQGLFNTSSTFSQIPVIRHVFQYYTYDAVIALGLAACQTPGLFTGQELMDTLLELDFEGVSGRVRFDKKTRARDPTTVQYDVFNVRIASSSEDADFIRFETPRVAQVLQDGIVQSFVTTNSTTTTIYNDHYDTTSTTTAPLFFVYPDNSTAQPLALPSPQWLWNTIPVGMQIYGWVLASLAISLAIASLVWTARHRNLFVVRAAQPIFLWQIGVGVIIMAFAIFPFSFSSQQQPEQQIDSIDAYEASEEQQARLNAACVMTPWFIFIGFVTASAAIFSKTFRINALTQSGEGLRRLVLTPRDVMKPFVMLLVLNLVVLTAWTIVDDYHYVRVPVVQGHQDEFGRYLESYGACRSTNNDKTMFAFLMPLAAVDVMMVLVAIYECYKARRLPMEFAEVQWLALSLASFVESLIIGGPILIVTRNDPSAYFCVGSTLLFICCMTFLLPIFVPKFINRHSTRPTSDLYQGSKRQVSQQRAALGDNALGWDSGGSSSQQIARNVESRPEDETERFIPGRMKIRRHDCP